MNARANTSIDLSSETSLRNQIDESLRKVEALVLNAYGESGDGFRNLGEDIQDAYMDAIFELVHRAKNAWNELDELRRPLPGMNE
jgi:hypothetical protein